MTIKAYEKAAELLNGIAGEKIPGRDYMLAAIAAALLAIAEAIGELAAKKEQK